VGEQSTPATKSDPKTAFTDVTRKDASRQPALGAPKNAAAPLPVQKKLIEGTDSIMERQDLTVRGKGFPADCTGAILAIYYYAGIDLTKQFSKYSGGGVTRLYRILEDAELIHTSYYPQVGDIIFWDNTWDRNQDGKWNDELTHVGMVYATDDNGQIQYVHYHYREGVVTERMNLRHPDMYTTRILGSDVIINSAMRMRGEPGGKGWLAGQLWKAFGMAYLLP